MFSHCTETGSYATTFRPILYTLAVLCLYCAVNAERLPVLTYTVNDGLPRDTVTRVMKDSKGFIWLCTPEGVSRFDGVAMVTFSTAEGLPDRFVNDVLETRTGDIWIATNQGLALLDPMGFVGEANSLLFRTVASNDAKTDKINVLFETSDGRLMAGTANGLFYLARSGDALTLLPIPLEPPEQRQPVVVDIIEDKKGRLWLATEIGLFLIDRSGATRSFSTADGLPGMKIFTLHADEDGSILVGFREQGGICRIETVGVGISADCFSRDRGVPSTWVTDIERDSEGQLWVATTNGLCKWDQAAAARDAGPVCEIYNGANGLCSESIRGLAVDGDGNLWAGTSCGAKKVLKYGFTSFSMEDGLDASRVNTIFEGWDGSLYIGTGQYRRAVSRLEGRRFVSVVPKLDSAGEYAGWGWNQTQFQDRSGRWWVPTGFGLFRTPPISFESLRNTIARNVLPGKITAEAFRVFEDSRGDVWVALSDKRLLRWIGDEDRWVDHSADIGESELRMVSAFAEDLHGNIWIGTGSDAAGEYSRGRLIRVRSGKFEIFEDEANVPAGWMRDLHIDGSGRLWIASTESGVWRLDDTNADEPSFLRYTRSDGLSSNATASVIDDDFGRIYVGSWRGIDRLDLETGRVEHFSTADGLPGSFIDVAYRDRRGDLWFATQHGLARFSPGPRRSRRPPTALIAGISVNGSQRHVPVLGVARLEGLSFDSDENQVTVSLIGAAPSLGEPLAFEYRLAESDWGPIEGRSLHLAGLGPGSHRIELRSRTQDGIYSAEAAVLVFSIAAPIWQRWWFVAAAVGTAALVLYLIYRQRVRGLLEVERTRTRIATDLHDDIGSELSKISLLSELARMQSAADSNAQNQLLEKIAESSRSSVRSMRDIVWAIRPDRETLSDLAIRMRQHAEEALVPMDVSVDFVTNETQAEVRVPMELRRDLFLIFKESINNAAKHSGCSRVAIRLTVESSAVSLSVADDGRGFDPESVGGDCNGLQGMAARARAIGGEFQVDGTQGTHILVSVPLRSGMPYLNR